MSQKWTDIQEATSNVIIGFTSNVISCFTSNIIVLCLLHVSVSTSIQIVIFHGVAIIVCGASSIATIFVTSFNGFLVVSILYGAGLGNSWTTMECMYNMAHYRCEETNPPMIKKATGCRYPDLSKIVC